MVLLIILLFILLILISVNIILIYKNYTIYGGTGNISGINPLFQKSVSPNHQIGIIQQPIKNNKDILSPKILSKYDKYGPKTNLLTIKPKMKPNQSSPPNIRHITIGDLDIEITSNRLLDILPPIYIDQFYKDLNNLWEYCCQNNTICTSSDYSISSYIYRMGPLSNFVKDNKYIPISVTKLLSEEEYKLKLKKDLEIAPSLKLEQELEIVKNIKYNPNEAIFFLNNDNRAFFEYMKYDTENNNLAVHACKKIKQEYYDTNTDNWVIPCFLDLRSENTRRKESANNGNLNKDLLRLINRCIYRSIILLHSDYLGEIEIPTDFSTISDTIMLNSDITGYYIQNGITTLNKVFECWDCTNGDRKSQYVPDRIYIDNLMLLLDIIEQIFNTLNEEKIYLLGTYTNEKNENYPDFSIGETIIRYKYISLDIYEDDIYKKCRGISIFKFLELDQVYTQLLENYTGDPPLEELLDPYFFSTQNIRRPITVEYGGASSDVKSSDVLKIPDVKSSDVLKIPDIKSSDIKSSDILKIPDIKSSDVKSSNILKFPYIKSSDVLNINNLLNNLYITDNINNSYWGFFMK